MSFAVVRHPDIEALGILPHGAFDLQRINGWYRVSEWRDDPADLYPPDYAEVFTDLDAPQPPATPAEPERDEE